MVRGLMDVVADSPFGRQQAGLATGPPSVNVMAWPKPLLVIGGITGITGIVVATGYILLRVRRPSASGTLSSIPSSASSPGATEPATAITPIEEVGTTSYTIVEESLEAGTSTINIEISSCANNETVPASASMMSNTSVAVAVLTAANNVLQTLVLNLVSFILSS